MISVIITAKNESATIAKAVSAFLNEDYLGNDFEIIVVAPDNSTLSQVENISPKIKAIADKGEGKPAALNFALGQAQGDFLIFSDGDVEIETGAVAALLKNEGEVVTGQPLSVNNKKTMLGFWQYILVSSAHNLRLEKTKNNKFIVLSGYLFGVKSRLLKGFSFPEDTMAEDEYLSYYLWKKGRQLSYAPEAKVKVKFPDNYKDWLNQKSRTLGATYQIPGRWKQGTAMRSFSREALKVFSILKYAKTLQQLFWIKLLLFARLHVWLNAWWKVKVLRQSRAQVWVRIASTK